MLKISAKSEQLSPLGLKGLSLFHLESCFWRFYQMIVCLVLIAVIFLGWLTTTRNKPVSSCVFITFSSAVSRTLIHNLLFLCVYESGYALCTVRCRCDIDYIVATLQSIFYHVYYNTCTHFSLHFCHEVRILKGSSHQWGWLMLYNNFIKLINKLYLMITKSSQNHQ